MWCFRCRCLVCWSPPALLSSLLLQWRWWSGVELLFAAWVFRGTHPVFWRSCWCRGTTDCSSEPFGFKLSNSRTYYNYAVKTAPWSVTISIQVLVRAHDPSSSRLPPHLTFSRTATAAENQWSLPAVMISATATAHRAWCPSRPTATSVQPSASSPQQVTPQTPSAGARMCHLRRCATCNYR